MSTDLQPRISASTLRNLIWLDNNDTGTFTCVGIAPSKGRRCQCRISIANQDIAESMLRSLPGILQDHIELQRELLELATRALCVRWHRDQALKISRDWYLTIVEELRHRSTPPVHIQNRRTSPMSVWDTPRQERIGATTISSTVTVATSVTITTTVQTAPRVPASNRLTTLGDMVVPTSTATPSSRASTADASSQTDSATHPAALPGIDRLTLGTTSTPASPLSEARPAPQGAQHHGHTYEASTAVASAPTDEDAECYICYRAYEDPYITPCGHKFCRECIGEWLRDHNTCPYDRRRLLLADLVPVPPVVVEEQLSCIICYEECTEPSRTPCGHVFCYGCITQWLRNGAQRSCPYDRRPLEEADLVSGGAAQP